MHMLLVVRLVGLAASLLPIVHLSLANQRGSSWAAPRQAADLHFAPFAVILPTVEWSSVRCHRYALVGPFDPAVATW